MVPSFFLRVWDAVKPPPPVPLLRPFNRAQRRLIRVTTIVIALGASAWAAGAYIVSAPDRAQKHFTDGEFTTAIEIDPNFAEAYLARGEAYQANGQTDAALADFNKAIDLNPTLWQAFVSRGMLWISRSESKRALADFTQSIHMRPTAKAFYQRGSTYQTLNQPDQALVDFTLALDRDPDSPNIYRGRAKAKRDLGDVAGARKDLETAELLEKTQ